MTPNRARAYGRVLTLIDDLGPAKLHPTEQQAVRDAADAVLFAIDVVTDPDARRTLKQLDRTLDGLVASGRLLRETADTILDAVEGCGPQTEPLALPAAA
jgi:hypothetical protein